MKRWILVTTDDTGQENIDFESHVAISQLHKSKGFRLYLEWVELDL